jgi:hypothetical protein
MMQQTETKEEEEEEEEAEEEETETEIDVETKTNLKSFHSTTLLAGKYGMTGRSMSLSSKRLPLRMREGKNSHFRLVRRCSGV